jgi:hypothetical protein
VKNRKPELTAEIVVAEWMLANEIAPSQLCHSKFASCSVEELSVRATSQPTQVLRTATGRTSLAVLFTIFLGGFCSSSVAAQASTVAQLTAVTASQLPSSTLAQFRNRQNNNTRNNNKTKKEEQPADIPELRRDKLALPSDYRIPPVVMPELLISNELPIPDKTDKNAWNIHRRKMSEYNRVLIKGTFGDEKAEREILRYGINFRLNQMTHRNLLYPSDEERVKVVEAERKPEAPETLITVRDDLVSDLRKTGTSNAMDIRDAFLDIFVEEAPRLLENNTYVRYQVGYLLSTFNNRDEDKSIKRLEEPCLKATKVLIDLVNNDKIHFLSKLYPIRGLARICQHRNCKPEDRFVIIETLVKQMAAAKTLHWWFGDVVAESLCQLGDPLDRAKNPVVAEALFSVIKDSAYPDRVRVRAAYSLARIPLETFKRTDEIAIEILRLGNDLAQAYEKDPKSVHWREDFMMLYLAFQPEGQAERKELKGLKVQVESKPVLAGTRTVVDEAYQQFLPLVQNVIGVRGVTPIPDQLRKIKTWLDAHPANKNVAANPPLAGG